MEPSEAVIRGLLSAAPDAVLAVDSEGLVVFANDQVERLFGWTRSELVGQPVEVLIPPHLADGHPRLRGGYMRHPTTRPMGAGLELTALRKDGSRFPAEISLSSFRTDEGELVAAAIRDVTVSRRSESRFRAVLASAPDAIVGVDADGRIEVVNEQAERLFGWPAQELLGQQVEVLIPAEVAIRHEQHRRKYVADPQVRPMGAGLHLAGRRRDGSTFPAEISLSGITEGDDGPLLVLAAVRDITERMELEAVRQKQALDAQREQSHRLESLGQLAGGVAHDFNNLLGVILNYTALLLRRETAPNSLSDLEQIRDAAERGAALTRQLLAFARRDVANPEAIDVAAVIRDVGSMLDRTLGEHVDLVIDVGAEPLTVLMDRHQLEQILLNLALNSRDAMPSGGTLTIKASPTGSPAKPSASITVTDTGVGMAPEVQARAFEPFFTTKPHGQGTGLGLATVYGLMRQNGGEVDLESEPGAGTAVTLKLRRLDGQVATKAGGLSAVRGGNERILLVEDETPLRIGTARLLADSGYDVLIAENGLDALDVLAANPGVRLVLTDVAMPRMRGDDLARELKHLHPELPVVLMTGYDSGDAPLVGRMLAKPVSEEVLLRVVRETLDA